MKRPITQTLSALCLALAVAYPAMAQQASGIDLKQFDTKVRAQDDFNLYVNGTWLKNTEIPADKSRWGTFNILHEKTQDELRVIVEDAAKKPGRAGSEAQKIGDLYASFMDIKARDAAGLTPLKGELARIAAIKDKKQIPAQIAHFNRIGVNAPYDIGIHQDAKDATVYIADVSQSGLGMPDRDYYLKDDDKIKETRAKYLAHIEKMLGMAGDKNAAQNAKDVLSLETEIAKVQWSKVENRDPVKTYNRVELAKLDAMMPGYDWMTYLSQAGVGAKLPYLVVSQPTYFSGLNEVIKKTSLDNWKTYFTWKLLSANARFLSKEWVDERFAFAGTVLTGAPQNRPDWQRAMELENSALGEALGKLYVEKHFPAEAKTRMKKMVDNLLLAFKQGIDTLDWMTPATKKEAQAKLAAFTTKIGYPDKWRDYSGLQVKRGDLLGNAWRASEFEHMRNVKKLGKPVDRSEWFMSPQTINAYYNPEMNEIVFPASILQAPFFDLKADDAVNYGAIGGAIGHEISHGFDDQGSQYDGLGNLRDWWTKEDHTAFEAKTSMLVKQYDGYSPVPGYNVNGKLTLGENIGDTSGMAVAYKAYQLSLGGKPAPVIDGFTGDQRFFIGWGVVWRSKTREAQALMYLKSDPHSPSEYRIMGTMENQPAFYKAFDVKPGDKMYLPPEQRVIIW